MMDNDTKARRCMKRKLAHRAAQLRKMADELDALAGQLYSEACETGSNGEEAGPPS